MTSHDIEFARLVEAGRVRILNDGVMGGLSRSQIAISPRGTVVFEGFLSLEEGGGFASVRTDPQEYSLAGTEGMSVRVRGDGRTYRLRVRTDDQDDGTAYQAGLETAKNEWIEVSVPFIQFRSSFRGRSVPGAPDLDPARIRQIGFMIADREQGPFRLEIEWVRAYLPTGETRTSERERE